MQVRIQGDGIAAACSAHLLNRSDVRVVWQATERPRVPVILLTGAALTLMGDIFGPLPALAESHRIRRRVVSWGDAYEPVTVEHPAVVVSEQFLLATVKQNVEPVPAEAASDWFVLTSPPLPAECREHNFGIRRATAVRVDLRDRSDSDACWVESIPSGWLFLIPASEQSAYLLAVGASPEELILSSRLIAPRIGPLGDVLGSFPTHPRLYWPLCGPGWLACGSAAMAFDPLCGDGTAQAVREAILAAAVLQEIQKGGDPAPLLSHYQARLAAGMSRHLMMCSEFYRTGGSSQWWTTAVQSLQQGAQWCATKLEGEAGRKYQMNGFELRPVA